MITVKCPKCQSKVEVGDHKTEFDDKTAVFCSNENCSFYKDPLIGIDRKAGSVNLRILGMNMRLKSDKPFKTAVIKIEGEDNYKALEERVKNFTPREGSPITEADERLLKKAFLKLYKKYPEIISLYALETQSEEMVNDAICRLSPEKIDAMTCSYWLKLNVDKIKPEMLPLLLGCKSEIIKNLITKHLKNIK